jgi:hypothetical protein
MCDRGVPHVVVVVALWGPDSLLDRWEPRGESKGGMLEVGMAPLGPVTTTDNDSLLFRANVLSLRTFAYICRC